MKGSPDQTLRERILNSAPFLNGSSFTVARMKSQLGCPNRTGVANALDRLVYDSLVVRSKKKRGRQLVYFYKKKDQQVINILSDAWVSTPTSSEFTPEYF